MKFFTPKEIAVYCGVDKVTAIRWIHNGDLPAIRKEKRRGSDSKSPVYCYYYVSEDDLRAFLEKTPKYSHVIDIIWPSCTSEECRRNELTACLEELASLQEHADYINERLSVVREKVENLIKAEVTDQ